MRSYRVGKGLTRVTTGRDPMTPMGLYISKTLLSEVETRGQRRVVMVSFVYEFRLEMLSVASVVVFNDEVDC